MRSHCPTLPPGLWFALLVMLNLPPACDGAVELGGELSSDAALGLAGDIRDGRSLHGMALLHAEWTDVGKSADARRNRAYLSILGLGGEGPTKRFVGDLLSASNSEGSESLRLYSTWWEASRGRNSWRAGLLLADEEFALADAGGELLNSSFGWPVFISANVPNGGPAFYAAGLGMRLHGEWGHGQSVQLGVYDGDTFDSPTGDPTINHDGLHNQLSSHQGLFAIVEYGTPADGSLRGKLGAWLHTGDFPDFYPSASGPPGAVPDASARMHAGNRGVYAVLEHHTASAASGARARTCHARVGTAPADRNSVSWAFDLGAAWYGLLPSRPDDMLALGFTHAQHGAGYRLASAEGDESGLAPDYEQVIELTYRWTVSDRLSIQPDLQYIRHLGGSAMRGDGMLLLVRMKSAF